MPFLLSIRTVFPKRGGRVWYDDQRNVHRQIFAGEEVLDYAFMGRDPAASENTWLREAANHQIPLIYFLGVSPGRYQAIIPTFVADWDAGRLSARIAFGELAGATATAAPPDLAERRYALRLVKQRLHQASFRDQVRGLRTSVRDQQSARRPSARRSPTSWPMRTKATGQPVVANGLALSKIHHAAFDNHLIGIDADGRVHVSERLLKLHDGPLLEQSLKAVAGAVIRLPRGKEHHPDRDRLAARYDLFRRVA